jgi:hypothetical protein
MSRRINMAAVQLCTTNDEEQHDTCLPGPQTCSQRIYFPLDLLLTISAIRGLFALSLAL